jgi:hypothetical protein
MSNDTATETIYRDGQLVVENGITIKVGVENEVSVSDEGDTLTITSTVSKFKASGTGWCSKPFSVVEASSLTISRVDAPDLARELMWAMAIGGERHTESRLAR